MILGWRWILVFKQTAILTDDYLNRISDFDVNAFDLNVICVVRYLSFQLSNTQKVDCQGSTFVIRSEGVQVGRTPIDTLSKVFLEKRDKTVGERAGTRA